MGVAMGCKGNSTSYISQTLQNPGIFTRYLKPVADQLLLVLTWLQCAGSTEEVYEGRGCYTH